VLVFWYNLEKTKKSGFFEVPSLYTSKKALRSASFPNLNRRKKKEEKEKKHIYFNLNNAVNLVILLRLKNNIFLKNNTFSMDKRRLWPP